VTGELENLKVTYPADFALAERLLASRVHGTAGQRVAEDEHPAGRAAS
jgi:hypothetical protein